VAEAEGSCDCSGDHQHERRRYACAIEHGPAVVVHHAALIAAQGAAQIATIRSTSEDGGGGTQRRLRLSQPSAAMGRSLHVTGIDLRRSSAAGRCAAIDQINDEVRNGATLISTGTLPI
jgi:hypothetical protein